MSRQSKMIFSLLVITTVMIYGCNNKNDNSTNPADSSVENVTEIVEEIDLENNESKSILESSELGDEDNNEDSNVEKKVTVQFNTSEGNIQEEYYTSIEDIDLNRPSSISGSEVFIGWEETDIISQISDNSLNTDEAMSLTAETEDISEIENAIYNDTSYIGNKLEYVEIPIIIGGSTNFSVIDLEVTFDTELFSFDSFTYTDDDSMCNCTDDGKILVSFVSTSNVKADVNLCNIKLKKNTSQNAETELSYNVKDIAAWNDDATDYIDVTYRIVNDKIVMY